MYVLGGHLPQDELHGQAIRGSAGRAICQSRVVGRRLRRSLLLPEHANSALAGVIVLQNVDAQRSPRCLANTDSAASEAIVRLGQLRHMSSQQRLGAAYPATPSEDKR